MKEAITAALAEPGADFDRLADMVDSAGPFPLDHAYEAGRDVGVRVIRVDSERQLGEAAGLGHRRGAVLPPAEAGVGAVHEADHGVQRWRVRIQRPRLLPESQSPPAIVLGDGRPVEGEPLHPEGPGLNVGRRRVVTARLLALGQPDLHLRGENERDLVLYRENVIQQPVVALRPDM